MRRGNKEQIRVEPPRSPPRSDVAGFDPEPWRGELRAFLQRVGAGEDAEDIVQETFLRAVRTPPTGRARAWLYSVALNLCRDRGRRARRTGEFLPRLARSDQARAAGPGHPVDLDPAADPATTAENRDLAARAWKIIQNLPDHQRAALVLRIDRQFTYRDAAQVMRCAEATVRQHFYLGMKAVRAALLGGLDD